MTKIYVDVEQTHYFLTPSGDIGFANDELDTYESERAFGENGLMPTQSLGTLIDGLLQSIADGHDDTDIPRLSDLAKTLKVKLASIETLVSKLAS